MDAEVLIIGAGVSGLGAAIELLKGDQRAFLVLEGAESLGGTWRDNTYPGVAVDIPISSYCFSYEMSYPWSRLYAPGHEVLDYLRRCAVRYGVEEHIRYGCRVERATFDAEAGLWTVLLTDGRTWTGRYLIAATGLFATPVVPPFEGAERFTGATMHSARWDHDVDLTGKRVGVIGTGASAVQVVPEVAKVAEHLTVFQRTPIWVAPRMDFGLNPATTEGTTRRQRLQRRVSELAIEVLTFAAVNYTRLPSLVKVVQAPIRRWMRGQLTDPVLADKLMPGYDLGCKRPTSSDDYLATFNRPNVTLETSPIVRLTEAGVQVEGGDEHELDVLVYATGFKTTHKGNQPTFEVVGLDGVELSDFWDQNRLQSFAGIAVRGFPNFFLTAGPYSGGFNWFAMLETHLKHIMDCLFHAWETGQPRIEVNATAYREYVEAMWALSDRTVFKSGQCTDARSYYIDRHGDASLPSPRTPGQRAKWVQRRTVEDFDFA